MPCNAFASQEDQTKRVCIGAVLTCFATILAFTTTKEAQIYTIQANTVLRQFNTFRHSPKTVPIYSLLFTVLIQSQYIRPFPRDYLGSKELVVAQEILNIAIDIYAVLNVHNHN